MSGESMECGRPEVLNGVDDGELEGMGDYGDIERPAGHGNPASVISSGPA
jgi:hypothetical protein